MEENRVQEKAFPGNIFICILRTIEIIGKQEKEANWGKHRVNIYKLCENWQKK